MQNYEVEQKCFFEDCRSFHFKVMDDGKGWTHDDKNDNWGIREVSVFYLFRHLTSKRADLARLGGSHFGSTFFLSEVKCKQIRR